MHQRPSSHRRTWLEHGLRALAGAGALAMMPASAWAQAPAYPTKPVHIVVTFTPGGAPDILARVLADNDRLTAAIAQLPQRTPRIPLGMPIGGGETEWMDGL